MFNDNHIVVAVVVAEFVVFEEFLEWLILMHSIHLQWRLQLTGGFDIVHQIL